MAIFDRFGIKVVASAGLCGAALVLSSDAAAAPLKTSGYECLQGAAGAAASPVAAAGPAAAGGPVAAAGGPVPAAGCSPASAPLSDMAGVPLALPGPVGVRRCRLAPRRVRRSRLVRRWCAGGCPLPVGARCRWRPAR